MARTKEQIDETKQKISNGLKKIVHQTDMIQTSMDEVPQREGTRHQPLSRKERNYIVSTNAGITADYTDSQGNKYHISILKI